ncbi:MAG TPA: hypothetical protein PLN64_01000 [Candidatus Bipolaricaulis anaerobius]|nr:hypothetical protein [Candidatus Bipolaricaulis anaerobius]
MNTTTTRRQIEALEYDASYFYGAVRLVKVEGAHLVDVESQETFVDVTPTWLDRPWTAKDVADFALDLADEYDARNYDVVATLGDEAKGLPILWVLLDADLDTVYGRMERERLERIADNGRTYYNAPDPAYVEREAERRLERGLVRVS